MNAFEATVKINESRFGVSPLQTFSVLVLTWMRCVSAEHKNAWPDGKIVYHGARRVTDL